MQGGFFARGAEDRDRHVARLAPRLLRPGVQVLDRRGQVMNAHPGRNPAVTIPDHTVEPLGGQRPEDDRRGRLLERLGGTPHGVENYKPAPILGRRPPPRFRPPPHPPPPPPP